MTTPSQDQTVPQPTYADVPEDFDPRAFIANSKWVFAKTMPHVPHEYTVRHRTAESPEAFVHMALYIREHGYKARFGKTTYTYLDVDGWHYWTMGAPINTPSGKQYTFILNRARGTVEDGTMKPTNQLSL